MSIYTRTGDKGQTSLFNGQRVSKSDLRVEAYGTIDELNSIIGLIVAEVSFPRKRESRSSIKSRITVDQVKNKSFEKELIRVQNDLFQIGSALASPQITNHKSQITNLDKRVKDFESSIDKMTDQMPALSNFILPGGGLTGAMLHFARTVCRRAERKIAKLKELEKIDDNIIMYVNRLSDLLFTMARFVNYKEKKKEILWSK